MRWMFAAVVWIAASTAAVDAQDQRAPAGQNIDPSAGTITVVGCVQNAVADGSLGGTPLGTSATPADAGVVANVQPQVEGYILTGARPAARTAVGTSGGAAGSGNAKEELRTYALDGKVEELARHRGQRVEVTGTLAPPVPSGRNRSPDSSADAFQTGVQRLRVQTLTKLADSCQVPDGDR